MKTIRFDFLRFCVDHNVSVLQDGSKHCRPGWVQLEQDCMFCEGNEGHHLGYNLQDHYFHCWRCGHKHHNVVIAALLNVTPRSQEVYEALQEYKDVVSDISKRKKKKTKKAQECVWPFGTAPLQTAHRNYLRKRGFASPTRLARLWGLQGTGCWGPYKYRIIAPVYYNRQLVSYQGRDISGKSALRYKACSQKDEVKDHKHCLYGSWLAPGDTVVVVEGILDAWRLGPGAVATFGINYTTAQLNLLSKYTNCYIFFDSADPQARAQAKGLAEDLSVLNMNGTIQVLTTRKWKDPGEMPQVEANKLMRRIFKRSTTYR